MIGHKTRMTQQEWFDEFGRPGKQLTLDEQRALVDPRRSLLRRVQLCQDRLDLHPQRIRRPPDRRQRRSFLLRPTHRASSYSGRRTVHAGMR
jgi:hypothetical protein